MLHRDRHQPGHVSRRIDGQPRRHAGVQRRDQLRVGEPVQWEPHLIHKPAAELPLGRVGRGEAAPVALVAVEQVVLAVFEHGPAHVGDGAGEFALDAHELRPRVVAGFFEEVGQRQAGHVVVGPVADRAEEGVQ